MFETPRGVRGQDYCVEIHLVVCLEVFRLLVEYTLLMNDSLFFRLLQSAIVYQDAEPICKPETLEIQSNCSRELVRSSVGKIYR